MGEGGSSVRLRALAQAFITVLRIKEIRAGERQRKGCVGHELSASRLRTEGMFALAGIW
jgi:hypothetical protein